MKKFSLSPINFLNFFIFTFPLSFIIGNFFVNFVIFSISLIGIFIYKQKLFQIKKNNVIYFIIIFFIILILSTIIENYKNPENNEFGKSILFLRYLVFILVIRCMVLNNDINFNLFFSLCLFFSFVVSLDIIFQYFYGYNILGFESGDHRRSSFFGEEVIAGGYIQRFSVLGFFSIPFLIKKKPPKLLISIFVLCIFFIGIYLSGNRMPTIMFLFFIFLLSIFVSFKRIKYIPQITLIFIFSVFIFSVNNYENFHINYKRFLGGIPQPSKIISELKNDYPELEKYKNSDKPFHAIVEWKNNNNYVIYPYRTGHTQIYITSIDIFIDNPLIGRGIRSFRHSCWEKLYLPNRTCQSHPHNYYLEILNNTGAVGMVILLFSIILLLVKNYKKFEKTNNLFFYPFFFSIIIEFFPIKSSGSFFSTSNASFIFFLLGVLIGLQELRNKKLYKNSNFF